MRYYTFKYTIISRMHTNSKLGISLIGFSPSNIHVNHLLSSTKTPPIHPYPPFQKKEKNKNKTKYKKKGLKRQTNMNNSKDMPVVSTFSDTLNATSCM